MRCVKGGSVRVSSLHNNLMGACEDGYHEPLSASKGYGSVNGAEGNADAEAPRASSWRNSVKVGVHGMYRAVAMLAQTVHSGFLSESGNAPGSNRLVAAGWLDRTGDVR